MSWIPMLDPACWRILVVCLEEEEGGEVHLGGLMSDGGWWRVRGERGEGREDREGMDE